MPGLLGIECGATHTVTLHESGGQVVRAGFGPANLRLLNNTQLARHLRQIAKQFPKPSAIAEFIFCNEEAYKSIGAFILAAKLVMMSASFS